MSAERQDRRPLRVLVVDDHRDTAETLARLLHLDGHEPRFFTSGPDALRAAAEWWPDVVVVDLLMPEVNGYDVATALLAQAGKPRPLVIAHTGTAREADVRKCREAGFDHFLEKPVKLNQLAEIVARHRAACCRR